MGARVEKEVRVAARRAAALPDPCDRGRRRRRSRWRITRWCGLAGAAGSAFSPKRAILAPRVPLEPGRSIFAPAPRARSGRLPGARRADRPDHYPEAPGEDFLTLVEAPDTRLGWTAVTREAEGDIVFVLKDPEVLPVTMLWFSNGGRDAAALDRAGIAGCWGSRTGLPPAPTGIGRRWAPNPVRAEGVATALTLGPRARDPPCHRRDPEADRLDARSRGSAARLGELVITGDTGRPGRMDFAAGFSDPQPDRRDPGALPVPQRHRAASLVDIHVLFHSSPPGETGGFRLEPLHRVGR